MNLRALSLLLVIGQLAACGPSRASLPAVDLFEQPVADAPDPVDRAGAAANYVECRYGISQGGWSVDFGPSGSGSDPDGALARFLDSAHFALPARGFVAQGQDQHRVLYTYSVAGDPKTAVIVADGSKVPVGVEDGWGVETFASCDPAEFDPSIDDQLAVEIWLDAAGNRVPTFTITSRRGPAHCDWESVTFLRLEQRQYVSDPRGVLDGVEFVIPFDDDVELPADATDTGYRRDGRQLWISADGSIAYLVAGNRVEAWPSSIDPVACA